MAVTARSSRWRFGSGMATKVRGVAAVVELVDRTRLRLVGSLIVALADGSAAIERWVKANGGPVGDA